MPGKRIVLLEMSTEDAEEFVRTVDETSMVIVSDRKTEEEITLEAQIAAVVAKPTAWCRCNVPEATGRRRGKRESGWTRGTTFGWWLCIHCHKPSRPMVTHFITNMLAGANDLLPRILGTGDAKTPDQRWRDEGGIPNPHANASPAMPFAATGTSRRSQRKRRGSVTER